MNFNKIYLVVVLLIFYATTYAQFEVEFNTIEGKLENSDKYKKDFGRYDGYEIELYEGEAINIIVQAEKFSPRLFLAKQSGIIFKEAYPNKSNISSIITIVPESGQWIIYVVGDSTAEGNYTIQMAIASQNSVKLKSNADFCTTLNFLLAHAKAYFLLIDTPLNTDQAFIKLPNSEDAFIDEKDGSYIAKFYEGNSLTDAENIYKKISNEIIHCLKDWQFQSKNWQTIEDFKIKGNLFLEKGNEVTRYIQVSMIDLRKSKQKFIGDFIVQLEINRKD